MMNIRWKIIVTIVWESVYHINRFAPKYVGVHERRRVYGLLDRAFAKLPGLTKERSDFVIPKVDLLVQGTKTIIRNLAGIADVAKENRKTLHVTLARSSLFQST